MAILDDALGGVVGSGVKLGADLLMYDKSRRDNIAQWQRENEYNAPKNQMKRLEEAGLNPNLVYGHGAVATGGSIAPTRAPTVENPLGSLGKFTQIKNMDEQLEGIRLSNALQKQNIRTATASADVAEHNRDQIMPTKVSSTSNAFNIIPQVLTEENINKFMGVPSLLKQAFDVVVENFRNADQKENLSKMIHARERLKRKGVDK